MKRLISVIAVLALVTILVTGFNAVFANEAVAESVSWGDGYVISRNVSVRVAPEESAKMIFSAKNGDVLNIVGENGSWYTIKLDDGTIAYAHSAYIMLNPKVIYLCSGAPVYAAPSLTKKRVGYVSAGDMFVVIAETDNYYLVNLRTAAGYIPKNVTVITLDEINWYLSLTPINGTAKTKTNVTVYPSPDYKVVRRLDVGEIVTIRAVQGDYYAISYWSDNKELIGFVKTADININ